MLRKGVMTWKGTETVTLTKRVDSFDSHFTLETVVSLMVVPSAGPAV